MIVVDASVLVLALADDTAVGGDARSRLREGEDLHAPHLVDVEVAAALRRLVVVERSLKAERAMLALADLADLPLRRHPHTELLVRAWELRHTIRPYDGTYVALAEALDVPLLTADARLAAATGPRCRVQLISLRP